MKCKRRSCLGVCQKYLFYLGLWPVNENQKGVRFYAMRIVFPRAMIFRCIYSLIFQTINVNLVWKETYRVVEHSMQIIFYLLVASKYATFFINKHRIRNLFTEIERLNDRLVMGFKRNSLIFKKSKKICNFINKCPIPVTIYCAVILTVFLAPMGLRNRVILLRLWFPYDASYTPMFELTFVTTGMLVFFDILVILICDTLFCVIILQLICQYEMLRNDLEHIARITEERTNNRSVKVTTTMPEEETQTILSEVVQIFQCRNSVEEPFRLVTKIEKTIKASILKERARLVRQSLVKKCQKDFVRNHNTLIKLTKEVQFIFKITLAVQIMANLSQAVNVLYVSTLAESFDSKSMAVLGSVFFGVVELFAHCMMAGYLSDESAKLHYAAYACDWVHMPKTFKSSLCIIMARSQHAFIMRAAGIPLSRRTFRTICKATYYLHTLLHKIYFGEKFVQRKE